ncbi:MAG: RNA polymerase sigma factor [Candidatus Egerieousia sp.]
MEKNKQDFISIILENKSTIYTVCYMFSKDKDEIEDLFQEILLRLWKGFESFTGKSNVKTWIYRVSLNSCLDNKKKNRRSVDRIPLNVDIDLFEDIDKKALQIKQLYARINKLGLLDRGIILLWLEGLSYDEIAEIVGLSIKSVSWRLVQIKNKLKNQPND